MRAILDLLRRPQSEESYEGGKALLYVWALEQKDSRRGWDESHEQDVMVPWILKGGGLKKEKGRKKRKDDEAEAVTEEKMETEKSGDKTFLRYYHLYRKGELEHDIEQAGGRVVEAGYEKDNWWAIAMPEAKG